MENERLVGLETKLAFQEQISDQLSDVLRDQQSQLDALKQSLGRLTARMGQLEKTGGSDPLPDEKPPHY